MFLPEVLTDFYRHFSRSISPGLLIENLPRCLNYNRFDLRGFTRVLKSLSRDFHRNFSQDSSEVYLRASLGNPLELFSAFLPEFLQRFLQIVLGCLLKVLAGFLLKFHPRIHLRFLSKFLPVLLLVDSLRCCSQNISQVFLDFLKDFHQSFPLQLLLVVLYEFLPGYFSNAVLRFLLKLLPGFLLNYVPQLFENFLRCCPEDVS